MSITRYTPTLAQARTEVARRKAADGTKKHNNRPTWDFRSWGTKELKALVRQLEQAPAPARITPAKVAQASAKAQAKAVEIGLIAQAAAEGRIRIDACGAPVLVK